MVADAEHREELAAAAAERMAVAERHTQQLLQLLEQNTVLTSLTKELSQRIETLTLEVHTKVVRGAISPGTA